MVLPIGGFMPIPLAMMIPFMATQSMVMGDAFGQAFQYGKRKISAMSNEEFNSTTMEQLASQMFKAYQNIIPDLKQSIEESRSLQALIVTELLRLPTSIFQEVTGSTGDTTSIKKDVTPEEFEESLNKPFGQQPTTPKGPGTQSPHIPSGPKTPKGDLLSQLIKVIRHGATALPPWYLNRTEPLKWWLDQLTSQRGVLNSAIFQTFSDSAKNNTLGSVSNISTSIHEATGNWY